MVARFREAVDQLWTPDTSQGKSSGRLGIAVSGGPDSLALLLLAHAAMPNNIAVLSIDHGLRAEAVSEVALVEAICTAVDVPFKSMNVRVESGNLQAKARDARYTALAEWAKSEQIGAVATAHHADDQAETLLMRLSRGSGLAGLAGVRRSTFLPGSKIPLIRPLLWARKTALMACVDRAGVIPVQDPSNVDPTFDRVRVRQHLAEHDWLDAEALAVSAEHLAEGWRALEWYAQTEWDEMVEVERGEADQPIYLYAPKAPRIIQIETICRIIALLGGQISRSAAGRAADRLWRGENASLGGVLATASTGSTANSRDEMRAWRFCLEPPRQQNACLD